MLRNATQFVRPFILYIIAALGYVLKGRQILVKGSGCEHGHSTLIEAVLILSWSNVQVNSEEKLCASRVKVHRQ
jgi:hypothetical protein